MSSSIENKVALGTGANRGFGKAIVESFLSQGAKKVYLAVRNPEATKALEKQFGDKVVSYSPGLQVFTQDQLLPVWLIKQALKKVFHPQLFQRVL